MFRSGIFMGHPQRLGHGVEASLQEPTLIPTPTVASNVAKSSQSWSGPYDLPAGEVATTCAEDLARLHRHLDRLPYLFQLALVGPAAHLAMDLGGDDCPLPPAAAAGEPVVDDGFRLAWLAAVAVGGVEEVDPLLMGNVNVRWPAE
jgi:hypothetical protein